MTIFDKPYWEMTEEDPKEWLDGVLEHYAPTSTNLLKTKVRKFFQWVHYGAKSKKGRYPLTQPSGRSLATLRAMPAWWQTSTTRLTSL